ncbi:MAG: hypothetical protein JO113_01535 [Candidatus Eremiobacteraeota bacterium]|nr:hypothetical protein [Candidatus Eremiobacteraeota bacterium]
MTDPLLLQLANMAAAAQMLSTCTARFAVLMMPSRAPVLPPAWSFRPFGGVAAL